MSMAINSQRLGHSGENAAASWLEARGFQILERNWHYGKWELDIICRQGDVIHFIEVKTRSSAHFGNSAQAVAPAQRKRLLLASQAWLAAKELWANPCQFDIIYMTGYGDTLTVEHYANAFNWEIMDSGNAHWQYW